MNNLPEDTVARQNMLLEMQGRDSQSEKSKDDSDE